MMKVICWGNFHHINLQGIKNIMVRAVTHDLDFARNADRIIEMKDGRIV
jgi:ABC-type lipoprotein export system ATPase subunit